MHLLLALSANFSDVLIYKDLNIYCMDEQVFHEAFREIEKSVAKFVIEFEIWLEPIGDVLNLIKILPKQITSVGDSLMQLPDKDSSQKFLLIMALYRGYLYGEFFINGDKYKLGEDVIFTDHSPKDVMDIMLNGRQRGDNIADSLDLFFHILVSNSKNSSIEIGGEKPTDSDVEKYMMMGLMVRFSELKLTNQNKKIDLFNDVVMLNPNFFGLGINFNKIISFLSHK